MASSSNNFRSTGSSSSTSSASGSQGNPKKKECFVFEPQQWRRTVCKNCYRNQTDHPVAETHTPSSSQNPSTSSSGSGTKALSPRTSPLLSAKNKDGGPSTSSGSGSGSTALRKNEASPTNRRRPKSDEFKQKTPSPRENKRVLITSGSNNSSTSGRRSPLSRQGGVLSQSRQSSLSNSETKYADELENEILDMADKYEDLKREKSDLARELEEKELTIVELQEEIEIYKTKVTHFERRVQHLEVDIRSYRERLRLPESDQIRSTSPSESGNGIVGSEEHEEVLTENEELRARLHELEVLCQDIMEENEVLKEDQEEMQREIEEMHDNFQEEDTDTLRELRRDLETSNKNCRIFQFKLRKTERRYEQCENERAALEEKLARLERSLYTENDLKLIRSLEDDLRMAKEVSVRLNSELDVVDEKRIFFEDENRNLKNDLNDSDLRRKSLEAELSKCRQEIEKLKSMEPSGALKIPESGSMRRSNKLESLSREPSFEEQSLQREIDAAKERETDLNEQLKYSEEEIHKLKRRLNDAEEENDSISKKLESVMKSRNLEDTDFEDASMHALKIQSDLLEQENSTLRKKFVSIERENLKLLNDFRQLKPKQQGGDNDLQECLDENYKSLEKKILDLQSEVDRVEKENRRLNILNSLHQSQSQQLQQRQQNSAGNSQSSGKVGLMKGAREGEMTTEFIQAAQIDEIKTECTRLKEQVKQYEKNIKRIMVKLEPKDVEQKQVELFKRYDDVLTNCKTQERQIQQMRRNIDMLKEECNKYKDLYEKSAKLEQAAKEKLTRTKTKSELENASKSVLLEEIVCMEDEINELASKCEKAETKIGDLTDAITEKEKIIDEMLLEHEKTERALNTHIDHLMTKNGLLTDLLGCVEIRANELQMQFDRTLSDSMDSCSETTNTENSVQVNKIVAPTSAGSDDVFNEPIGFQINVPGNLNDAEKIKFRLSCMDKLLSEERKRTRIAEKQAEMALKDSAHSRVSEDSQLKKKEIEMLKSDLEEKNEMLEEKEQNISDLRNRLDQTRKMNEALRTLLDKQDEAPSSSSFNKKDTLSKEYVIELNSYKKEIAGLKSDINQYIKKIAESERSREKLTKEVRNLQAEMKIREESIYEQDDEVRAKDQEIRSLNRILEETQKKLKNQNDASVASTSSSSQTTNQKIAGLEKEVKELQSGTEGYKAHIEELELEIRHSQNEQKMLHDSVRTRDERIKEKDDLISHINQRLQNREKELTDFDNIIKQSNDKLLRTQEELKSTQTKLSSTELELSGMRGKFDELQASLDKSMANLASTKQDNERLRGRVTELEKKQSHAPSVSSSVSARSMSSGPTLSSTVGGGSSSTDVDKLRSEIAQLKKDKDNLTQLINKDKGMLRRDSGSSKTDSAEAYTRAIQQQQYVTRVNLLTDNVTRLNRQNIELKLQNESVQNEMLDFQRRFKNIKEQYDAEQESWVAERITLESRMKEHEDRKSAIISLRKSLQDASLKVADLEAQLNKEKQQSCMKISDLEQSKQDIQKRLSQYEEQQKLPKVLQRFGGKVNSRSTSESLLDKEKTELKVRLDTAEKSITKLRNELVEKEDKFSQEKIALIKKSEEARLQLNILVQSLTNQLADMDGYKEKVYLLRERLYTMDDSYERDKKIWNEERMCLLYKLEDSRMIIEGWLNKVRECENDDYKNSTNVIEQLEKEIDKYLHSKDAVPFSQIRRRLQLATSSGSRDSGNGLSQIQLSSVPSSPGTKSVGGKAISMDWTNTSTGPMTQSTYNSLTGGSGHHSSHTDPHHGLSTSTQSLLHFPRHGYFSLRSNRSVSPDTASLSSFTQKVTNYPDPTPGFLIRPSSRQSSVESLKDATDYSQRSFTLPGLRNNRNPGRSSPARQRFFDSTPTPQPPPPSSSSKPPPHARSSTSNAKLHPPTITTTPPQTGSSTTTKKDTLPPSQPASTSTSTSTKPSITTTSSNKNEPPSNTARRAGIVAANTPTSSSTKSYATKKDATAAPSTKPSTATTSNTTKNEPAASKKDPIPPAQSSSSSAAPLTSNKKDSGNLTTTAKKSASSSSSQQAQEPTQVKLKPISQSEQKPAASTTASKSKSISIAPSIAQLRMKFAKK